ncbi:MAG: response regulator transcription factor, partial [Myxococcota bacterium]
RRQVAAFSLGGAGEPLPVCLRTLLRDARAALRHRPIMEDAEEGDYTVELDRARFLPILVELLDELAASASTARPLLVGLRGGDCVRLHVSGGAIPASEPASVAAARRFLAGAGGRVLLDPEVAVTIEVPAFGRALGAGPHRSTYGTVLIVDDDESTLAMMGAVLTRAGFRVLSASDGVVASALFRQHRDEIVAVVADAVLPGRSGIELATEARRSVPELPVLLISGHSSDLLGDGDAGHLPILTKPFGARVLTERVRALLAPLAARS